MAVGGGTKMRHHRHRVRQAGLLRRFGQRMLGRGERLIAAGKEVPLVVASFPRGRSTFAEALAHAVGPTFRSLPQSVRDSYQEVLKSSPPLIVADLRARNVCNCLGHHHPSCLQSALARRLADDLARDVGEIDLAIEAIREWEPQPLASLAALEIAAPAADRKSRNALAELRFQARLLAVFLHELEHLCFPSRAEAQIRGRSDAFYFEAFKQMAADDFGVSFGITADAAT